MQNNKINKKTTIGIGRTVLIERSLIARPIGNYPDTLAIGDAFIAIEVPIATTNSGTIRGADAGMFPFHHGIITIIVLVAGMKDRSDRKGRENDQCLHDVKVDR